MIFGGKKRNAEPAEEVDPADLADQAESTDLNDEAGDDAADEAEDETTDSADDADWRADGPFDADEVELESDGVNRFDLGALVITPWPGMGLQLQMNESTQQVTAALAVWQESGIQLSLLAAPTSGGLAADLREDLVDEAESNGGSASVEVGPFGPEVRRVLPVAGPAGEQLFQETRNWFAEGPRWLLIGTVLGQAARPDEQAAAEPFEEFFRNVVVRRGDKPMVPGDVVPLTLPAEAKG